MCKKLNFPLAGIILSCHKKSLSPICPVFLSRVSVNEPGLPILPTNPMKVRQEIGETSILRWTSTGSREKTGLNQYFFSAAI